MLGYDTLEWPTRGVLWRLAMGGAPVATKRHRGHCGRLCVLIIKNKGDTVSPLILAIVRCICHNYGTIGGVFTPAQRHNMTSCYGDYGREYLCNSTCCGDVLGALLRLAQNL